MKLKLGNFSRWLLPVAGAIVGGLFYYVGPSFGLLRGLLDSPHMTDADRWLFFSLLVAGGFIAGFVGSTSQSLRFGGIEIELEPIRAERKEIEQRIESRKGAELDIFNVIQLGLNQITEYYTINKSQARNSFRASMGAVVFGFLILSFGIALNYRQPGQTTVPALSAVAGVLLQFIGGAYFYLYNRSLHQLNFFYDALVRLQDTMLAVQQVDQLSARARDKAREGIIKALMRAPVNPPRVDETKGRSLRRKAQAVETTKA